MKPTRLALIPVVLCLLLTACGKKDDTPYKAGIKGVNLRTVDALPAGIVGTPDVYAGDNDIVLYTFPNPATTELALLIRNTKAATHMRLRMISVIYDDAPATAVIENAPIVGACLVDQSVPLPLTGANPSHSVRIDISKLPRGFYRLYAETDEGGLYWDNIWLMK